MPKIKQKRDESELDETVKLLRKRYGDNTVLPGRDIPQPDRIPTGIFVLDLALLGGIPHNRATMVVGERHSGKSMVASMVAANAQRMYPDQKVILLDVEGTFEQTWAEKLGVDLDELLVVPCETGEMACDVGVAVLESADTSLVIVDSVAALTPMKELDSSAEDAHVGLQARLVGSFVRKVTSALISERKRGHYVTLLLLNQYRSKIGGYGDPRTIPGGKALEYSTSVQIDIKNREKVGKTENKSESVAYNEHPFRVTKNKLNGGIRNGEFIMVRDSSYHDLLVPGDVDDAETVLSYAKKFGFYSGGGTKWVLDYDDGKHIFGKAKEAIEALMEDRDMYWGLRTRIIREQAALLGMPEEFITRIE